MNRPDYQNSIVNLMSSILGAFDCQNNYQPLNDLKVDIKKYKNIVCIVIDALGHSFLSKQQDSFLYQKMVGKLSSVFPTTTSSAVTSFLTAQAPLQHAMTGWYMYFKELASAAVSLPFAPRFSKIPFDEMGVLGADIFNHENAFDKNNIPYRVIFPNETINSAYSKHSFNSPHKVAYEGHKDFFTTLETQIKDSANGANMILAYYPFLDATAHVYGINSPEAKDLFIKIDNKLNALIDQYADGKTLFLITADHGMVDVEPNKKLYVKDYPEISDALILPLCGENRVPFCYVRPAEADAFESFMKNEFSQYCSILSQKEALDMQLFGVGEMNQKLIDRVGDYIIFMHENYVLLDPIYNEKPSNFVGFHGGLSDDELYVPLISIG